MYVSNYGGVTEAVFLIKSHASKRNNKWTAIVRVGLLN